MAGSRLWRGIKVMLAIGALGLVVALLNGSLDRVLPSAAAPDPLAGRVVFGDSFDQDFEVRRPRTKVLVGHTVAWVAHTTLTMPGGQPIVTVYLWNGVEWIRGSDDADEDWNRYGGTLTGAVLYQPGRFTVRVLTVGNEVLAEGSITVEEP